MRYDTIHPYYDAVRFDMIEHNAIHCDTMQFDLMQKHMMLCNSIWY